ncbi:MAG: hypothetical protein RIR00_2208 [Pseudomonadota bacterium]|jgi:hypothetical protein
MLSARTRLSVALGLLLGALAGGTPAGPVWMLLQTSPLAGSQYYALLEVLPQLKVGDRLDLVREPDNPHDRLAIRVEWRGRKLGYLPRLENRELARAMDAGERLRGRVLRVLAHDNPWQRLEIEVYVEI